MIETPEQKLYRLREHYVTGWMKNHSIKTSNGLPFEFRDHAFMIDPLNDLSPLQVWLKPPQIGATEGQIVKTLYVANNYKKDIIYTLPTASDVHDLAGSKINRIVAQNPILMQWVKEHDTVDQKYVGEHVIHYRGTFSTKQAMMVSSQLNVHDEVDASDPEVITQYETRQQATADGWRWYFSHPSLAGHGVDIYWNQSDKKEWFVTCINCKQEQILEWPGSIDRESGRFQCKSCKGTISDDERRAGKWIPTATGNFSGYHISQLMCPWISAEKVIEAYEDPNKTEQYFYNYVLGLPYASSDDSISKAQVLQNVDSEYFNAQEDRVFIGVDTGLPIYYMMMNKEGVFYYGKCGLPTADYDPYKELESFLLQWPRSIIVSDQGGDLSGIRQLKDKYPGRVYLCYYRKDRKTNKMIQWGDKGKLGEVYVDRNRMMQMVVEQLKAGDRIPLHNGTVEEWTPLAEHFENIYRVAEETPYGIEYKWERKGADHWVHAMVYMLVAYDHFNGEPDIAIRPADGVSTALTESMSFNDLRNLLRHDRRIKR